MREKENYFIKMNKKNFVSIIITYYKKKKYLAKTLKSISDQSFKNFEIIFVYDDKDKNDLKFVKKKIKRFKKKKLIINKINLGVSKSRNLALKYCKGDFISFIDADDIWKKNKLFEQIKFMKKKTSLFCFTSYEVIDEFDNVLSLRRVDSDASYETLSKSNYIGLSTVLVHKKIAPKIRFPNLQTQEDLCLWLKLLKQNVKLHHYSKILSSWRKTENSLSSKTTRKLVDAFKLFYIYENKNFIFSIFSVLVLSYNKLLKLNSN